MATRNRPYHLIFEDEILHQIIKPKIIEVFNSGSYSTMKELHKAFVEKYDVGLSSQRFEQWLSDIGITIHRELVFAEDAA